MPRIPQWEVVFQYWSGGPVSFWPACSSLSLDRPGRVCRPHSNDTLSVYQRGKKPRYSWKTLLGWSQMLFMDSLLDVWLGLFIAPSSTPLLSDLAKDLEKRRALSSILSRYAVDVHFMLTALYAQCTSENHFTLYNSKRTHNKLSFILGHFRNRFTCFNALVTHQFSHSVYCCSSVFPLCLKHARLFKAPLLLNT